MSTRNEPRAHGEACSPTVLAASTDPILVDAPESPRFSSLLDDPLGRRADGPAAQRGRGFRLTERDQRIVELVARLRAARDDQVQVALFSVGAASRCQLRLTQLVRGHYLDRLPRASVNAPTVYVLSRRSVAGNRLLRERLGEGGYQQRLTRLGSVEHLLAINDVRVRVERACNELGWSLPLWHSSEQLGAAMRAGGLVPDAYFQIRRSVGGEEKTAAFFLELERAGKSSRVVEGKLRRYADLYYSGRYRQQFGTRALRVLVVYAGGSEASDGLRIRRGLGHAERLGTSLARFTSLVALRGSDPVACLTAPYWWKPGQTTRTPLFEATDHERGDSP